MAGQAARRFSFRLGRRTRLVLRIFGVKPGNAYVDLGDTLDAHFGFFRFQTPTSNLVSWRIEGPWRWITAIGVRLSWRRRDLTFGGTNEGGIRLDLREPVVWHGRRIDAFYLTLEDAAGFTAAITERGIPGVQTMGQSS